MFSVSPMSEAIWRMSTPAWPWQLQPPPWEPTSTSSQTSSKEEDSCSPWLLLAWPWDSSWPQTTERTVEPGWRCFLVLDSWLVLVWDPCFSWQWWWTPALCHQHLWWPPSSLLASLELLWWLLMESISTLEELWCPDSQLFFGWDSSTSSSDPPFCSR